MLPMFKRYMNDCKEMQRICGSEDGDLNGVEIHSQACYFPVLK
jgi:hypothetical protein